MPADEPGAQWIPCPNYFANRNGYHSAYVIVHGTAGFTRAEDVGVYFQTAEANAHYVVGRDGVVVQCVSERDGAWANGPISAGHDPWWTPDVNPNWITISIEHVKPSTDNSDTLTQAQQDASFRLVKHICERHGIPMRRADSSGGITGHYSMDPVNRSRCPGPYPWDELFAYLQQNGGTADDMSIDIHSPDVSTYFTEVAADRWHCTDKAHPFDVAYAILSYYKANDGLRRYGLPISGEYSPQKGVSIQNFERGAIAYDPGHLMDRVPGETGPCYTTHVDKGPVQLALVGALVKQYEAQIAQLQAQLKANPASPAVQQLIAKAKEVAALVPQLP